MKKQTRFRQDIARHNSHFAVFAGHSERVFPGHLLSLRRDIVWPQGHLIGHLVIFFLWGDLKTQMYKLRPTTLHALKDGITQAVAAIPP
ncbi:hypothetical protein TNIN_223321 [Trichonephila inaurata madagascariensis]|uniref:Uncharacterized protein n=1 Tax=Trichonephila inaurata madagascariensis TaxID=2747483 RepID=A0A8X7BTG8_9ARAC|nr:hypothetical protein TNIN_223321 [Trichonephila inaurata madagascariensis]